VREDCTVARMGHMRDAHTHTHTHTYIYIYIYIVLIRKSKEYMPLVRLRYKMYI
jgi:hypothetical protein